MMRCGSWLPGLIALATAIGTSLPQHAVAGELVPSMADSAGPSDAPAGIDASSPRTRLFGLSDATLRLAQGATTGSKGDAKEPLTRDMLFGSDAAEPKAPYRLGGFFQGAAAYTYADPVHWSRGVGRLQLVGQGEIADAVKWKLSGRVDGDVVFATSDFYLDPVKKDQRLDFFWGENYIDFSAGSWDFRLGAQQIIWGEVVGLFVADVVSAHDMREFLLPSFDLIRIPQWAARAEYTAGDSHVEFVWIPVPTFDNIGKPGSDFYPAPLPTPTPTEVAALFEDPERPARKLSNSSFGFRANTLVAGWDIAAFYYRSYSVAPTFYREPSGNASQPFV